MRFLGSIEAKTDSKGRAFLPAVFRKVLSASGEELLVMRKDIHQDCLVLYPESVWNEQLDLLKKRLNLWNAAHKQVFRKFVSDVEIISLDGNGRFLIPKRYLKIANIEQSIKFIGMDDTIEIWSNDGDGQPIMDAQEFSRQMEELMGGNGNEQEKELTV
jgi:MraZ protein